ncbi:hypothetical protein BH11PSE6_BH11PSE6_09800 [soil metagenome]
MRWTKITGWLIGLAAAMAPMAATAHDRSVEVDVDATGLDLTTAAGLRQFDQRLRDAVARACAGHSRKAPISFPPGPGGKGQFIVTRGKSDRDVCRQEASREMRLYRARQVDRDRARS